MFQMASSPGVYNFQAKPTDTTGFLVSSCTIGPAVVVSIGRYIEVSVECVFS